MNLQPLFLASTGRAGSTLMMKILSHHPGIAVRTIFPYEIRAAQYYYIFANHNSDDVSLFSPIKFKNAQFRAFLNKDTESIAWTEEQEFVELEENGVNLIDKYYSFVSTIEDKPNAKYFAEKCIGLNLVRQMSSSFPSSKIIFLRRDPRDTFFSAKSFNAKRGSLKFGEQNGDEAMFQNIVSFYEKSIKFVRVLKDRAVIVKYENLLNNKKETLSKLFKSLELDYAENTIKDIIDSAFIATKETDKHRTTTEEKNSISRWEREASSEDLAIFNKSQDTLTLLDY